MLDLLQIKRDLKNLFESHGMNVPDLRMSLIQGVEISFQGSAYLTNHKKDAPVPVKKKDVTIPDFIVVADQRDDTYSVESKDGVVMRGITSFEAARHFAALCCLGYIITDSQGWYYMSPEHEPEGVEIFEEEDYDDVEVDQMVGDDGPTEGEAEHQAQVDSYYKQEEATKLLVDSTSKAPRSMPPAAIPKKVS